MPRRLQVVSDGSDGQQALGQTLATRVDPTLQTRCILLYLCTTMSPQEWGAHEETVNMSTMSQAKID